MVFENVDFYSMLDWFGGVGGFDIILPFLLIFTITFAILQKIKLFGEKRNIDMIGMKNKAQNFDINLFGVPSTPQWDIILSGSKGYSNAREL